MHNIITSYIYFCDSWELHSQIVASYIYFCDSCDLHETDTTARWLIFLSQFNNKISKTVELSISWEQTTTFYRLNLGITLAMSYIRYSKQPLVCILSLKYYIISVFEMNYIYCFYICIYVQFTICCFNFLWYCLKLW